MVQVIIEKQKLVTKEGKLRGEEAILAVLARAADDSEFLAQLAENPYETLECCLHCSWRKPCMPLHLGR